MSLAGAMAQHASVMAAQKKEKDALIEAGGDFSGIRPLEEKDLRVVRQLVGQSVMEGLAESNVITYFNRTIFVPYVVVAITLDYLIGWWPQPTIWWSWVAPLIGFAALALPGMFIVEIINRGYFESLLRLTLGSSDFIQPTLYYTSPNAFYVFILHNEILGLVALDASTEAGKRLDSVIDGEEDESFLVVDWFKRGIAIVTGKKLNATVKTKDNSKSSAKSTATKTSAASLRNRKSTKPIAPSTGTVAHIRHLYVDSIYRRKHIATELVDHALKRAFASGKVDKAIVLRPGYATEGAKTALKKIGFHPVKQVESTWAKVDERDRKSVV